MWYVRQAVRLVLELVGAVTLAAAVAAAPARGADYLHAFARTLLGYARLDFGVSAISGLPAAQDLAARIPATLELAATGAVLALLAGTPLGYVMGRGRALRGAAPLLQLATSAPAFCAALAFLWIAARLFGWTYVPDPLPWPALAEGGARALLAVKALSLPGLTVGAAGAAAVQYTVRRAGSDAMTEPCRQGLRRLGLGPFEIEWLHLVPQIGARLLAGLGEIALVLFSAVVVSEWLFGWPGAAVLFLKSVALHDWNVAAVVLLVFAAIGLLIRFCGSLAAQRICGDAPP